ncbi:MULTISPECIES: DUF4406 domain-containing protein [Clostridium]|jgi:hypothetical protein|uniref:DUF4406 domain-containing protein n=1 Tax=Clostridium TaxID=1485 RepID=UPI000E87A8FB|nr:DUF4406 domain-containing protein [Clostridium tyrobutyricum]HBG38941.1 hypothetical protein [Clostridiaceae bacterium]
MKKVYVAHPYNGLEQNKKDVENIIKNLVTANPNIAFISPIHTFGYLYDYVSYEKGMEYCFEVLKNCNELLLCIGWENSRGCKMEKEFAEEHNIPVRYYDEYCTKSNTLIA